MFRRGRVSSTSKSQLSFFGRWSAVLGTTTVLISVSHLTSPAAGTGLILSTWVGNGRDRLLFLRSTLTGPNIFTTSKGPVYFLHHLFCLFGMCRGFKYKFIYVCICSQQQRALAVHVNRSDACYVLPQHPNAFGLG